MTNLPFWGITNPFRSTAVSGSHPQCCGGLSLVTFTVRSGLQNSLMPLDPSDDAAWSGLKGEWCFRPGTLYLNHGSFGPPPKPVRQARQYWQDAMDSQPMDFFVRQLEPALRDARERLAQFVGAPVSDLIFVENATVGMNIVADSL